MTVFGTDPVELSCVVRDTVTGQILESLEGSDSSPSRIVAPGSTGFATQTAASQGFTYDNYEVTAL